MTKPTIHTDELIGWKDRHGTIHVDYAGTTPTRPDPVERYQAMLQKITEATP